MRKLTRLLAGVVLLGALVANASPALADHGVGHGPVTNPENHYDDPLPPDGDGLPNDNPGFSGGDTSAGWHEEQPDFAIAEVADPCVVTGTVDPGVPFDNNSHLVNVPLVNDNPAHSHFQFIDTTITCLGAGELSVNADGGNDGHFIDLLDAPDPDRATTDPGYPLWGDDGHPLELDLDDGDNDAGIVLLTGRNDKDEHDYNQHHGSVNESAWSHSANFAGGSTGFESNECPVGATGAANTRNKADINIAQVNPPNNAANGWVKYIRIGIVVYAWGCAPGIDANIVFSTILVILPNVLPADPTGTFPANPLNPICPLESITGPPAAPCGFILAGLAWRGPGWIIPTIV